VAWLSILEATRAWCDRCDVDHGFGKRVRVRHPVLRGSVGHPAHGAAPFSTAASHMQPEWGLHRLPLGGALRAVNPSPSYFFGPYGGIQT